MRLPSVWVYQWSFEILAASFYQFPNPIQILVMPDLIAVLDFGSQYTQVIARRIREANVLSRIYPYHTKASVLQAEGVKGVILSGGPASVLTEGSPRPDEKVFELGVPMLGICYGEQLMAHMLGGKVGKSTQREFGHGTLTINKKGKLFCWSA